MSELKPCPFCNDKDDEWCVCHYDHFFETHDGDSDSIMPTRIWQSRPLESALEAEVKRLTGLLSKHVVGLCKCGYMANWPVCTKCGASYPALEST